jgi:predicted NBD/HSP70 family sugar kinase
MIRSDLTGFAVDLGGTKIAAARIVAGEVVVRRQADTDRTGSPEQQVMAMFEQLNLLGFKRGDPIGIAVTGRIDRAGLWHAVNTGTLTSVGGFDLAGAVAHDIGPATCSNDAAAAALAEAQFGAGRALRSFAYLTVSTGIGGGLVMDGRLLTSTNGLAGHVGFTTSISAKDLCGSGRQSTVESVAGGRAIAAAARAAGHDVDARAVCAAALAGAPWAEAIIARSAGAVAGLVADLAAILGLDGIAIGGSIGLSSGYLARVRAILAAEPMLFHVPVMVATLGNDAPLLGALAISEVL